MAARNIQKLKLLHLYRMLERETDAQQGLTMAEILVRLEEQGIAAERKSIYRDIETLREFGFDVRTYQKSPVEYALVREGLSLSEIALLVDAVQSSRFLSERTSKRLVAGIKSVVSEREQAALDRRVHVQGRIKRQSESVFRNVDIVHEALQARRKVQFVYFKYGPDLEPVLQHEGQAYVLTPVRLVYSEGFYYLVTYSDAHKDFVTFRLDRMRQLQVAEEPATRNSAIANWAFANAGLQSFGMMDGKVVKPTLRVREGFMDAVVDRFGTDVQPRPTSGGCAEVRVAVNKSPQFFAWIAGMDGGITLAGPPSLVEEYHAWLLKLAKGDDAR